LENHADSSAINQESEVTSTGIPPALGCGFLLLLLVLGIACVLMVGSLAIQGQVLIRSGQPDEVRLWLVDDDGLAGLGFSYATLAGETRPDGSRCYQNHVRFLLWKGESADRSAEFCRCYQSVGDEWIDVGACNDT
jgi:hypothetical protein